MSETPLPELQLASENPWYMLATAGKDHAENTRHWNGYMRHLIGVQAVFNLRRAYVTPIELPLLSPDEMGWITRNIPGLPRELPPTISLSGLNFARPVFFQDFYFPVYVTFEESIFKQVAYFEKSIFEKAAHFAGSIFEEVANFAGSSFGGYAHFAGSSFKGVANFAGSSFGGYAHFAGSSFEKDASFTESIFGREVYFTESTFEREADFSNAKYEGKTSFQNVTFTVAPRFFATTLHEDTDWTGITWPAKPADKEDATQYVRRYDRLALMMSTLKQPDNEHRFFRRSMRAKEVRDGWGISTSLSRFYGLFRYGWGLERALVLWVFHILFGAGCLSVMALCQMSQPLPDLARICRKIFMVLVISFSNGHPFLGLHRGPAKSAYASFNTLSGFGIVWGTQIVSGSLLLFFLLLTIRNRFRFRFQ